MAQPAAPAITLTDPNNDPASPSPAWSPTRDAPRNTIPPDVGGVLRNGGGRPETPTRRQGGGRPESSSGGWGSPGKLTRTLSSSNGNPAAASRDDVFRIKEGEGEGGMGAMDPLSQHILKRTNAPPPMNTSMRPTTAEGGAREDVKAPSEQTTTAPAVQPLRNVDTNDSSISQSTNNNSQKDLRKGVKAVSFISRLMGNKKKDEAGPIADDESVSNEGRPEGTDAQVFSQPLDNMSFSPRMPQPPSYIKVRAKHKKTRDFDRLFLAQELDCRKRRKVERQNSSSKLRRKNSATPAEQDTVWAMEFSRDGKYLAAAGADGVVRVWAVLSSSEDRQKHEKQEAQQSEGNGVDAHAEHLSAPVFQSQPIREFEGHGSTILDLSWSKNNFLLSSSMDKTVRLWHVSRTECLCTFKHADFVPSVAFHPKDDRFFLAGSLDSRLRLWSIPDKSVAYTARLNDMVTAVAFTPDGKHAIAGCLSGLCMFYETEGLKYQTQVHVRSARGQNAKGSKITGIHAHHDRRGDVKLLITSNDSRTRLYNFRDKNLELKFRGNVNNSSQIRATVSDDGKFVACGSEDRKAYIWSTGPGEGEKRDKRPLELFEAHDSTTTAVCFAPAKTRHLLSKSEDPVYDLCNPPIVHLMSRAERAESQTSSKPPTENGSVQATPADPDSRFEKPKESASYVARSSHKCGNIIVTADYTGKIKIFRQDCAWSKRRLDDWDRSSIFSKRTGRMSRTGSVMTRGSQPSLREGRNSTSLSGPSDRILSWRQGIASSPSVDREASQKDSNRGVSPGKSSFDRTSSPAEARKAAHRNSGKWTGWATSLRSETRSDSAPPDPEMPMRVDTAKARGAADDAGRNSAGSGGSPRSGSPRSLREENPLLLSGGRSYMFWDTQEWKGRAERQQQVAPDQLPLTPIASREDATPGGQQQQQQLRPGLGRGATVVSELSDEKSSVSEYDDAEEGAEDGGGDGAGARQGSDVDTKLWDEGMIIAIASIG
ncbi:uncharacterized protein LTR77_007474 [Saxophila tyrrhenica]|uniref:WD repeat-containing protein 44 n=1 Tax=Saxophila tyrrhenica TaxID=1690608 RepID=A0AAV9P5H5_9PEZI|nr:hypothetical protein LTR77_007474 [Saxophila tyrrhenica]